MINSYYIFDDIIDSHEQDTLESYILDNSNVWVEHKNITGKFGGNINESFPGSVINWNYINQNALSIISTIENNVVERMGLQFVKNLRQKINKTSPLNREYDPYKLIHIDSINNHIVIIYYINNADGDTILFNNTKGNSAESVKDNFDKIDIESLKLLKSISPKKGRAIAFDGNLYHYGDYPTIGNRFVINYNTVAKNKIINNLL